MPNSLFEQNAPGLFHELEEKIKTLAQDDAEYVAMVIEKGIAEAKILLETGKPAEAEQKYVDTKILVERAEAQATIHAERRAFELLWVESAYLVALLFVGYFTHLNPNYWLWKGFITSTSATAWFGALGGVTIALFGLYSHIQARDFDPKFRLWYLCKPIIGAIFGWFVAFVYLIGLVAVQGTTANVSNPQLLYAIAFLAGFSERFTVKIIDRLMQTLTTWEDKPTGGSNTSPQPK